MMAMLLTAGSAEGANYTWTGATNSTWDTTSTNWTPAGTSPWNSTNGGSNAATFGSAATVTVSGAYANSVTFNNIVTLSSSTLTLSGSSPSLIVGSGFTATINSVLSGASITKSGAGILVLTNASNALTGTTTLAAGSIQIGANNVLGASAVSMASGTKLSVNSTAARSLSNNFTLSSAATLGDATNTGILPLGHDRFRRRAERSHHRNRRPDQTGRRQAHPFLGEQ
jgi:fibronectin-binding autotransporter adhesin